MRNPITLNEELLRKGMQRAAAEGRPLSGVIEDALRLYMSDRPMTSAYRLNWTTEKGELLPGVDLDDRDSFFAIMEGTKK